MMERVCRWRLLVVGMLYFGTGLTLVVADGDDDRSGPLFQPAQNRADLNEMLGALELETAPSGVLKLQAGKMVHLRFNLQEVEQQVAEVGGRSKPQYGILTIAVPDGFSLPIPESDTASQALKVLFVSVTGDIYAPNAYAAMKYYRTTRSSDWLLVAVDGNGWPKRDSIQWRISLMGAAMRYMSESLPGFDQAQFAYGGFSGGSKISVYLALFSARLGKTPIGLFLGGCNQVALKDAVDFCGTSSEILHLMPVVMSVGAKDSIAKPKQSRKVAKMLKKDGFESVEILTHPGGHRLIGEHVEQALGMFSEEQDQIRNKRALRLADGEWRMANGGWRIGKRGRGLWVMG